MISNGKLFKNNHNHYRWLLLIIMLYLLLGIGYSIASPIFETPDENHHYFTTQSIKTTHALPIADAHTAARQEAAQPPLYYLLSALLITPLDFQEYLPQSNPFHPYQTNNETPLQNRNIFIHTLEESWIWQGQTLAIHIIRLFSFSLGLGTLLLIYSSGRLLWPGKSTIALLATALIAFLPQFLFINSSVSNDSLIIFMSSAAIWQLIRIWQKGSTTINLVLLGLTIGFAILSKMTGLILFVYALGTLVLLSWRDNDWPPLLRKIGLVSIPVIVVSGWLFWRNWILYGDPTAVNQFVALAGGTSTRTLLLIWYDMDRVWKSVFAYFGWMTIAAPGWVYAIWNSLILGAGLGMVFNGFRQYRQRKSSRQTPLTTATDLSHYLQQSWFTGVWLAGWLVLVILGWLNFIRQTPADQGRLWFPAIVPIALGMAFGLAQLPRYVGIIGGPLLALLTAVYSLFWLILPTFAPPQIITQENIPPTAVFLHTNMGSGLTLLAADIETKTAVPGDILYATLYWRADTPPQTSPVLSITGQGQNHTPAVNLQTLHNSGIDPPHTWQKNQIIADRIAIPLDEETAVPAEIHLYAQLDENAPKIEFGRVKALPSVQQPLQQNPLARIGDHIQLTRATLNTNQARPNETIQVQLQWQALSPPDQFLTAFVHLGQSDAPPLSQHDAPPLNGDFPTTLWDQGDTITDTFRLTLPENIPAGDYPIYTGFYDSNSGERLPVTANGEIQQHHLYQIDTLHITQSP